MITTVTCQLKGETEPRKHYALVFEDVTGIEDFIAYRNALTTTAKCVITSEDNLYLNEEAFWLIQLSEFISTSLDEELQRRKGG